MEETREEIVTLPGFKRGNLVEMVSNMLKESILTGKFKDGHRLPTQETLAQQFRGNHSLPPLDFDTAGVRSTFDDSLQSYSISAGE